MVEISKTPLLTRIEELEDKLDQVKEFIELQGRINGKLVLMVNSLLSNQDEEGTAPHSGLILPDRLNS